MTARRTEALARLREIRDELGADGAPPRVNLRDYAAPGSPAWDAFAEASGLPGHNVRLNTMVARINQAIDALTAQLLGIEPPPAAAAPPPEAPPEHEVERLAEVVSGALGETRRAERRPLRRLTPDGIEYARTFLAGLREDPRGAVEPPRDLLYGDAYSAPFPGGIEVERRPFRTRREAAEYLAPLLEPVSRLATDDAAMWSWLGMFYFADTAPQRDGAVRLSPVPETFVVDQSVRRSYLLSYRHYLWGSWRLHAIHGERAAFLLDQDITSFSDLAERSLGSLRIFNAEGIVPLFIRLYTEGRQQKPQSIHSRGGLRHIIRVLDQMERTHDVYGMEPEALLRVLPSEFRAWDGGPGPLR